MPPGEAFQLGPDDLVVVNVQGDEPLLAPSLIRAVAESLAAHPDAAIATACHPIADPAANGPCTELLTCDAHFAKLPAVLYFRKAA